ncbi:MAG: efflux RND transporter periplasmic adaptor subunit [Bacteroidia bacterium]|jgi:HlyD family secretion protein|nr:efflux RND transporter periplasmic adaptor subunit [Bacteroidia bacterium]
MTKVEKQKKRGNRLLWILGISAILLIIIVMIGRSAGWIGKDKGIKVSVTKVELQQITESVTANGKIQPEVEVKISSDVSGEIRELYVKEGDSVKSGQLLARIDPELYQSALDRTEAALNNSRANLATAKARLLQSEARLNELENQYQRNVKLHQQKLMSDAEFETAKSSYISAKAEVDASKQTILASQFTVQSQEASLKESKKNLTRTEIFSPVNGIVSKLSVEKGERVVGTSQMAGTEMMRIANLNDMEVSVDVNENDIVKVSLGDTALVEVDAYGKRKFKGIVTEIANSATTTAQTTSDQITNFIVKIRILRSSYSDLTTLYGKKRNVFRPGMSASVDIQTQSASNTMATPIESVTMRDKGELDTSSTKGNDPKTIKRTKTKVKSDEEVEVVFVLVGNKAILKKVKTGIQNDKFIQVLEGLSVGEEVISSPYSAITRELKNGSTVMSVNKEELFAEDKSQ